MQTAAQENGPFQSVEGLAGKFHAYSEQQHGNAEFRNMVNGLHILDDTQQGRAAQNACKQKAHGGGQFYSVADDGDEN